MAFPYYESCDEFPRFDGSNLGEWMRNCREYFRMHSVPEFERGWLASMHFEGKAHFWFQSYHPFLLKMDWIEFQQEVYDEFKEHDHDEVILKFREVRQIVDVHYYQIKFEKWLSLLLEQTRDDYYVSEIINMYKGNLRFVNGFSEEFFVSRFIVGLQEEIGEFVFRFQPTTLAHAIYLAKLQEDNLNAVRRQNGGVFNRKFVSQNADSVQDYVIRFEDWISVIWTKDFNVSEEYLVSIFINGLRDEIKNWVQSCKQCVQPQTLQQARALAELWDLIHPQKKPENGSFSPSNGQNRMILEEVIVAENESLANSFSSTEVDSDQFLQEDREADYFEPLLITKIVSTEGGIIGDKKGFKSSPNDQVFSSNSGQGGDLVVQNLKWELAVEMEFQKLKNEPSLVTGIAPIEPSFQIPSPPLQIPKTPPTSLIFSTSLKWELSVELYTQHVDWHKDWNPLKMEHLKLVNMDVEDPLYGTINSIRLHGRTQLLLATGWVVYMENMRFLLTVAGEMYIVMMNVVSICVVVMVVSWLKKGVG